jgi:hypothetical protein
MTKRHRKDRPQVHNLERIRTGLTPMMRWLLAPTADHDAAKRVADNYNLHLAVNKENAIGQYIAVRMDDGTGDGTLYPTKRDAAAHQRRPEFYAYMRIVLGGLDEKDALVFLHFCRDAYQRGTRLTDPEDARTMRTRGMPG